MLMSLLIVLWLQCQLPSSAGLISTEAIAAQTPLSMLLTTTGANDDPSSFSSEFVQSLLSCLPSTEQPVKQSDASPGFSRYPEQITANSQPGATTYEQRPGYYAIRLADPEAEPPGAVTVIRDEKGAIAVFQGLPPTSSRRDGESPLPVYGTGDIAAVPTGEVFIRFEDGINASDRSADLKAAGYAITKVLDFAPQGAWIRAISGEVADSLQRLTQLEGMVGVENIEPQLLMERQLR